MKNKAVFMLFAGMLLTACENSNTPQPQVGLSYPIEPEVVVEEDMVFYSLSDDRASVAPIPAHEKVKANHVTEEEWKYLKEALERNLANAKKQNEINESLKMKRELSLVMAGKWDEAEKVHNENNSTVGKEVLVDVILHSVDENIDGIKK